MLIEYCKKMGPKKFNKLLRRRSLRGVLKMCNTLEEANFVLFYNTKDWTNSSFITKEDYRTFDHSILTESSNFIVCYVKHNNPRDRRSLELSLTKIEGHSEAKQFGYKR